MPIAQPEDHEIATAAYSCWERGGKREGHDQADWHQGRQLVFMAKNYAVLAHHTLRAEGKERLWLSDPRRCRYCGGVKPENRGWKEAHAVPELVGNKTLIAMDECTDCNTIFSRLEDDLGKLLHLSRAIMRIKGKGNRVPSFSSKAKKSGLEVKGDRIEIEQYESDPFATYDAERGVLDLQGESQPFVPIAAYKSLVKMGLAVMPPEHFRHFGHAVNWIKNQNHEDWAADVGASAQCCFLFQPGPIPPEHAWCMLLGRRAHDAVLPHMLFILTVANQSFQVMLPCSPGDNHWVGHRLELPVYPAFYGFGYEFGEPQRGNIPLSSPTKQPIRVSGSLSS